MTILVLGGNGFIGSHLVDGLLAAGHDVRVFDCAHERFRPPLDKVTYYMGNFGDPFAMAEALADVDVAYHLVSTTVPGTSNRDPVADIENNLVGTIRLLEQCVEGRVNRIVFLSSGGTVYGNPETLPVGENHRLNPICSYAVVKIAIENFLGMYRHLHGLQPTVLRAANPYGPRQGHQHVQGFVATTLRAIMDDRPLKIWGDGSVVRDYVYVKDLTSLCVKAGLSEICGTYNVGSGKGHSLLDIVHAVEKVVGKAPKIEFESGRTFDVRELVLDISAAKQSFEWVPQCELQEGIRRTWEWMTDTF